MVRAALAGALNDVPYVTDPIFGLAVPTACPDLPAEFLQPRNTWSGKDAYDERARTLARMFADNFATYADGVAPEVREACPKVM